MPVYKKVTLLGSGSFGKAFLVMEKGGDGTKLVLKSIDMSSMDALEREETLNEAKVFASIPPHPFIVRYRRSYILEDQLCIIMEHCAGGDMHRRIQRHRKRNERFKEGQIILWLAQALLGLKHLHERHILHRDLKPQNLFLNERDDLLIGDFGIAKILSSTHCCAKTTIGTPYYFSPELCQQHQYSFPSDVWSLGCIIYELCSLAVPFRAQDLKSLIKAISNTPVPAVPSVYSAELRQLVTDMMQKDPQRRPTVGQLVTLPIIQAAIRDMLARASYDPPSPRQSLKLQTSLGPRK